MSDKKYDAGKPKVTSLLLGYFPLALQEVARVSDLGVEKYKVPGSWREVENAEVRYGEALGRHVLAYAGGQFINDEPLPDDRRYRVFTLAQVAWNALAILELALRRGGVFSVGPYDAETDST